MQGKHGIRYWRTADRDKILSNGISVGDCNSAGGWDGKQEF